MGLKRNSLNSIRRKLDVYFAFSIMWFFLLRKNNNAYCDIKKIMIYYTRVLKYYHLEDEILCILLVWIWKVY